MRPVVLLSDFGWSDPYLGQMKGVLHREFPGVVCLDLCHDIEPHKVASGAWILEKSLPHMPDAAVFLCVVDPGVGGGRRALVVRDGDSFFVGPDNGLFTSLFDRPGWQAWRIDPDLFPNRSATFHGRDLFAPVAARLAAGEEFAGERVEDPVRLTLPGWSRLEKGLVADIAHVDRFGNLITALPATEALRVVGGEIRERPCGRLVETFSSVEVGEAALVVGGFGTVEVVVNQGSAHEWFGVGVGAEVLFLTEG